VSFFKEVREQCIHVSSTQNIGIPIFLKENALICIPRADKKCAKRGLSCAKRGLSSRTFGRRTRGTVPEFKVLEYALICTLPMVLRECAVIKGSRTHA